MDGQKIAGHYGYTPVGLWMQDAVHRAFWAGNLVVDEAYRRQGIGGQLIRALADEGEVGLDLGASPIAEPMLVKEGWTHMGALHRWVGVLDAVRAVPFAENPDVLKSCIVTGDFRSTPVSDIREVKEFDSDTDVFWNEYRRTIAYATDRNARYLNWRYAHHPVFSYSMCEAMADGKVQGFAVARLEKARGAGEGLVVMRIVELVSFPQYEMLLLQHLIMRAHEQGAVIMDFFCSSLRFGRVFEDRGFGGDAVSGRIARLFSPVVLSKWPISFNVIATNTAAGSELSSQEEWYATTGDGDQDRPNKL